VQGKAWRQWQRDAAGGWPPPHCTLGIIKVDYNLDKIVREGKPNAEYREMSCQFAALYLNGWPVNRSEKGVVP